MRQNNPPPIKTQYSKYIRRAFSALFFGVLSIGTACQGGNNTNMHNANSDTSPKNLAKKILAHEINAPASAIEVISVENTTWADSSLGCPEPGKFYAQMLVDGHLVVAAYKKQNYNIHLGNGGGVVCYLPEGILPTPEKN